MHAFLGALLAVAIAEGGRHRAVPSTTPSWVFWYQDVQVALVSGADEMWFASPGAGILHERGAREVLDPEFSGSPTFFDRHQNRLCAFQKGSIRCVTRNRVIQQIAFPPEISVAGAAAAPDGSIWFAEGFAAPRIGVLRPDGSVHEIPLPAGMAPVIELAIDDAGEVWFTPSNTLVHLRSDETFEELRDDAYAKQGWRVLAASDGALWILHSPSARTSGLGLIGAIVRRSPDGTFTRVANLRGEEEFHGVATAPDGSLWYGIESWRLPSVPLYHEHLWQNGMVQRFSVPTPPKGFQQGLAKIFAVDAHGNVWIEVLAFDGQFWIAKLDSR